MVICWNVHNSGDDRFLLSYEIYTHPRLANKIIVACIEECMKDKSKEVQLECPPIMVNARQAARLFGMSLSLWYQLSSAGRTPQPAKLNSKSLWSYDQLRLWANNGCPSRDSAAWQRLLAKMRQLDNIV
jgi:predicted DNA-binding transcriptional regulator AlpA